MTGAELRRDVAPISTQSVRWCLLAIVIAGNGLAAQRTCDVARANSLAENGWAAYRAGRLETAGEGFAAALRLCASHDGARVGMGYVALREDRLDAAQEWFHHVLTRDTNNIDALVGAGLVAFRSGLGPEAANLFEHVLSLSPEHTTALEYLQQTRTSLGVPPNRPPYRLPDTTVVRFRTHDDHLDVRNSNTWEEIYVKGVNLGAALPGKTPADFPESATYADWLAKIGAMGANTVRVYTIHPPRFYEALAAYNSSHPASPLYLVHGAWASQPPEGQYDDPRWLNEYHMELQSVVDVVHGRASLRPAGDEPYRHYTADVSRWTLAFVIGREWEPQTIAKYNLLNPGHGNWSGRFLTVRGGTAAERWMGQTADFMVSYEMEAYREQRPIAFVNWPTLDPLRHSSEATNSEEVAIVRSLGGGGAVIADAHNDDEESLDAARLHPTSAFEAGHFAAYHVYPYYPDFLNVDPAFRDGESPDGPSAYFGYLEALRARLPNIPILIAEYGVPSSLGISHLQPQGWHHGGHTEDAVAAVAARLTSEISEAGMAGGIYFSWIDEWFKTNWLVAPFEVPSDRNQLWLNRLNPEQHFGIIAMEPVPAIEGASLEDRRETWRSASPLYESAEGDLLRVTSDEAYLWLAFEHRSGPPPEELLIGFDTIDSLLGDHTWPSPAPLSSPGIGLEFVLRVTSEVVELLADSASNPWAVFTIREYMPRDRTHQLPLEHVPPGVFSGRWHATPNTPFRSISNDDGAYTPLRVVVNRLRYGRDSTEYEAVGYNRGLLPQGPLPDGSWEISVERDLLEIRIPWMLLNFTDPSSHRVLQGVDASTGAPAAERVSAIRIVTAYRYPSGAWETLPGRGQPVGRYQWPGWDQPSFRARVRPIFDALKGTFRRIRTGEHRP